MFNYQPLMRTASRLIKQYGAQWTYKETVSTYNPASNTLQSTANRDIDVFGVRLNYRLSDVDTEIVHRGDISVLVAAGLLSKPKIEGTMTNQSTDWSIVHIAPLSPSDVVLYYMMQLRR